MRKFFLAACLLLTGLCATAQDCPTLSAEPNSFLLTSGDTLVFTVLAKYLNAKVTYNWSVSAGTIISGQGTREIKVSTADAGGIFITATAEVAGLPAGCTNTVSATVEISTGTELVVKGTFISGEELRRAVHQFVDATGFADASSGTTAFIFLYKNSRTTVSALALFRQAILKAFADDKIAASRIRIVDAGEKKFQSFEMYELQKGAKDPVPSQ